MDISQHFHSPLNDEYGKVEGNYRAYKFWHYILYINDITKQRFNMQYIHYAYVMESNVFNMQIDINRQYQQLITL